MREMQWYVYAEHQGEIEKFNIFDHTRFLSEIVQAYKKYKSDFDTFKGEVHKSLRYYFWSKCEWEIVLSGWPHCPKFPDLKIDVYDQVMLNWDIFIKYVWEQAHARKTRRKT